LRIPEIGKRITPPLVDVLLQNGHRDRDVNLPEATYIAQEIARMAKDPALRDRTVGVVTLTSNEKQAIEIKRQIAEAISTEDYSRMEISVGPPPQFQGKERDVMFVSMVWDTRSRDPGNRMDFQQRFNVALSRARDRMVLVRSIPNGHAKPDNLLDQVIRHFHTPFGIQETHNNDPLERCETAFEREIGQFLVDRGYRVNSQVGRKGYRIDLVVEGALGKRLAIECDGDRSMTEHQWRDDRRRQRVLERAGWTYWRCFQAHYEADRAAVQADLLERLAQLRIEPNGHDTSGEDGWVQHLVVGQPLSQKELELIEEDTEETVPSDASQWPTNRALLSERCDSPFEKDILGHLLDQGFRVWPQYPSHHYLIDLVVQGPDGRRLAIECDGDSFHGLDKQSSDSKRQAFLENVENLTFWRCFYSDFRQNRGQSLSSLERALEAAGVRPWDAAGGTAA
jgi:very-short-patch-repair endonuclease